MRYKQLQQLEGYEYKEKFRRAVRSIPCGARVLVSTCMASRRSGTRGKPTGYRRTIDDRSTPIQKRGYGPKVAEFYAQVSGCGSHCVFYGATARSAMLKAENYIRRTLRDSWLELEEDRMLRRCRSLELKNEN